MDPIETKNQLWRLCTNSNSYRSRPGGTSRLQNAGVEFDSRAICHLGGWSSGSGAGLQIRRRGFESRSAFHVVTPTQSPRIGRYQAAGD